MRAAALAFWAALCARQSPRILTLWGRNGHGNGTGKTFLATLVKAQGRGTMLPWPKYCARRQQGEPTGLMAHNIENAALLVIDDAGAEHATSFTTGLLCEALDGRMRRLQHTIITSNLSPDEWRDRDARISSRLIRDGNIHVCCETSDFSLR